ncbi:hypothetical protein GCM10010276_06960 [Streptomyces longisporus]|uniref:Uncharacterized protein n=1 Tax=Streptomyces longisporus TaxID=1948 RepID=A0ABP5Y944_STRLO
MPDVVPPQAASTRLCAVAAAAKHAVLQGQGGQGLAVVVAERPGGTLAQVAAGDREVERRYRAGSDAYAAALTPIASRAAATVFRNDAASAPARERKLTP